jgi:hypothetical protein
MILKILYRWIANILFGITIRHDNIIEAIAFTVTMRRAVLSMSPVWVVHYKNPVAANEHLCIDYGLIFSASCSIQRYIVTKGRDKIYLRDDERITLFEN